MSRLLAGSARALGSVASLVTLLAAWELFARSGRITTFLLPPLSTVLARVANDLASAEFYLHLGTTVYRTLTGFAIASAVGIVLGVLVARVPWVRWFLDPLVSIGFPMPKVSFLPIFVLWFGLFDLSKITMTVVAAVFPVLTASWAATENVDRYVIWSAENMGASGRRVFWDIVIPSAIPGILTGLQVALPIALIVVIVSEMLMGGYGLGAAMITSARFADSTGVFAGIVEVAVVGVGATRGLEWVRRRLLVWHAEAQTAAVV